MPQKILIFLLLIASNYSLAQKKEPRLQMSLTHEGLPQKVQISPKMDVIITNAGKDSYTRIWDFKTGYLLRKIPGVWSLLVDQKLYVGELNDSNQISFVIYSIEDLAPINSFKIHTESNGATNNTSPSILLNQKSNELFSIYRNNIIKYNLLTGRKDRVFSIPHCSTTLSTFSFNPDNEESFNKSKTKFLFWGNHDNNYRDSSIAYNTNAYIFDIASGISKRLSDVEQKRESNDLIVDIQFGANDTIFCFKNNSISKYGPDGEFIRKFELKDSFEIEKVFINPKTNEIILNFCNSSIFAYEPIPLYCFFHGGKMLPVVINSTQYKFGKIIPIEFDNGMFLRFLPSNKKYLEALSNYKLEDTLWTTYNSTEDSLTMIISSFLNELSDSVNLELIQVQHGIEETKNSHKMLYTENHRIEKEFFLTVKKPNESTIFYPNYSHANHAYGVKEFDLLLFNKSLKLKSSSSLFASNIANSLNLNSFEDVSYPNGIDLVPTTPSEFLKGDILTEECSISEGRVFRKDGFDFHFFKYKNRFLNVKTGKMELCDFDTISPIIILKRNDMDSLQMVEFQEPFEDDYNYDESQRDFILNFYSKQHVKSLTFLDSNFTIYNRDPKCLKTKDGFIVNVLNYAFILDKNLDTISTFRNPNGQIFNSFFSKDGEFLAQTLLLNQDAKKGSYCIELYDFRLKKLLWKITKIDCDIMVIKILFTKSTVIFLYNSGLIESYELFSGNLVNRMIASRNRASFSIVRNPFYLVDTLLVVKGSNDEMQVRDSKSLNLLYSINDIGNDRFLFFDQYGRFDCAEDLMPYLYLVCGKEIIDLSQVKDSLWVPGLVEKIMNKEEIRIHDRPAPKLQDLNICELTPVIEPLDDGGQGLFRYRITPRNGGLGETEVYINGNLTYKFKPEQLEKKREQNKDIYYLSISSDTLQGFLTGDKGNENPILVKAKVKGSGIYGRGVVLDIEKETDKENPKFFGLFIGVNDYGNPNKEQSELRYRNLDFAAKDANDLSKAVEATARNLFQQDCYIYNLTGTGNAENIPTKANLQKALKEIGEKAKASDILYIFFAGHGDIPEKSGEKEIRFILHNADKKNLKSSSFGVEELSEWCHPKQIKAQKRVFVFDACHSGQIINQTLAFNGRGDEEATRIRQLDKLKDKNGMMILAAAADNESAYEDETLNQGVLTYHLLDAMKKEQDTSLIIRQWFDEAIEGVKEYARANGNKQEPNSFGDGRFEIGNVNEQVRAGIDITCPKTRVGLCEFMAIGEVAERYPNLKDDLSNVFKQVIPRGEFVLSMNLEKAYRVSGVVSMNKGKVSVQYEVKKGEQSLANVQLPIFKKNSTAQEILDEVTLSIEKEIETIDKRAEHCLKKKH